MLDRSTIEQELIDGLYYWDTIGPEWERLIERKSNDVPGHMKPEVTALGKRWIAVRRFPNYQANGKADQRAFDTREASKQWIEDGVKFYWLRIGAHGWPLVPSTAFPGELTLACPKCGSTNVTLTVAYGPGGRLGDPGATDIIRCEACKQADYSPAKPMEAR